jgi:hypothetical protein
LFEVLRGFMSIGVAQTGYRSGFFAPLFVLRGFMSIGVAQYYRYEKPSDEAAGRSLFAVECRSHDSSCGQKIRKSTICDIALVWLSSMEKTSRTSRYGCS